MTSWTLGPPVLVGERILWLGSGSGLPKSGVVRWIGHLAEISHDWTVGIELDEALPYGGIDGTWGNRVLFGCKSKHGLLVPVSGVIPASQLKYLQHSQGFQQNQDENIIKKQKQIAVQLPGKAEFEQSPGHPLPAVRKKAKCLNKSQQCHKFPYIQSPSKVTSTLFEESEYSSDENNSETLRIEDKDKPEVILQIKKREIQNVPDIDNGQARRMTGTVNAPGFEEAVIDSLYASRHHFATRVETRSESAHAFVSISNRKERGASGIFSFFRWFRKEKEDFEDEIENARIPSAPSSPRLIRGYGSTCGSVDTLFSTATASSFAFIHPELYRPFGNASQADKFITSRPETETYRKRLWQRDKLRELDKNISLRKKYHLFGSSGTIHRSADDVYLAHKLNESEKDLNRSSGSKNSTFERRKKRKAPPPPTVDLKPTDYSLPNTLEHISKSKNKTEQSKENNHYNSRERPKHRRTVSDSSKDKKAGAYCHVRGKRKAPPPPPTISAQAESSNITVSGGNSSGKKKRPAPPPPVEVVSTEEKKNSCGSLSPEDKLRLLSNIEKLKLHAEKKNVTETEPDIKMSNVVSNDSLKLEKGVLKANKAEMQVPEVKQNLASPVSPRPWYKRNIIHKENGKSLEKKKDKSKVNDWMPEVGIPRGSIISTESNRFSNIFSRSDEKRNSQISMLVNISELDREAAEIVRQEQEKEKEKLAVLNSKFYTDTTEPEQKENNISENENIEMPKKSSARELISLFNAIGNVTKVTVNSKFFSKNGPSIFSKEGVEKRFSYINEANEEKVVVQESVVTETVSKTKPNGYKRETMIAESQQTYSESPGVKRRRSLMKQISRSDENLPSSSTSSDSISPKVTIEEIDEFDAERASKTQAMYEANRLRKHLTPSPTIPTIVEMSESISSVGTTPGSTITKSSKELVTTNKSTSNNESNTHNRQATNCIRNNVEEKKLNSSILVKDINLNISKVDNKKEPNQNGMNSSNTKDKIASTINKDVISSNIVQDSTPAESNKQVKMVTIWSCPRCTLENQRWRITCEACDMWRPTDVIDNITANFANGIDKKSKVCSNNLQKEKKATDDVFDKLVINQNNLDKTSKDTIAPVIKNNVVDKMSLKEQEKDDIKYPPITNTNLNEIINSKSTNNKSFAASGIQLTKSSNVESSSSHKVSGSEGNVKEDTDVDEVRKARLAFFHKSEKENSDQNKVVEETPEIKCNTKKNTIATNEEERLKIKEMLKEMKNSLPKRSKDIKPDTNKVESRVVKTRYEVDLEVDTTKLGAIKKITPQKTTNEIFYKANANGITKKTQNPEKAEMYFVKNEIIIEDIKIKKQLGEKPEKVSTSVQTNGIVRKVENVLSGNSAAKPPAGRLTPKGSRKEFIVPISVEEYTIKDGVLYTSLSKERRRIGTGTFELIRPRDFASIEATKTGNENVPVHVYANVPAGNEAQPEIPTLSACTNSVIEANDVEKLSAELSQPNGLAEFKAGLEGSGSTLVDNNMNTLAVNRILRRLEAAIAGGQHQLAASLAKELARLKINCSVTRQKQTPNTKFITVDMFVEDKVSHQGPIPLQVNPSMTVAQLKAKVDREFEIPAQVQRWILGKQLAIDDSMTLEHLDVNVAHSPIFLYLVAPAEGSLEKDKSSNNPNLLATKPELSSLPETERKVEASNMDQPLRKGWYFNDEEDKYSLCETESELEESSKEPSPEPTKEAKVEVKTQNSEDGVEIIEIEEEEEVVEEEEEEEEEEDEEEEEEAAQVKVVEVEKPPVVPINGTLALGWKCPLCTLVNSPTRPGCLACTTMRPANYNIPQEYQVSKGELERMRLEVRTEKAEAEDKLKHYQQLVNLENADLVISTEPFDCSICLVNYTAIEGVVLRDCLHTFCRTCLVHTVEFSEEAEVKCPFRDDKYSCDSTLQEREIKALVTAEVYEQHLAKSVAQAENKIGNAFHCKTPDCRGWCIFEDNVNLFICPVCNQTNCLTCQAIHRGMNCKQFQEQVHEDSETNADARRTREMLEEMVDRGEAMNCPTCQVILMKKWGCDWLRCSMCKTEICWVTRGARWGPLGKGDTSGGCQCGVNGVKCHPKCNYCH